MSFFLGVFVILYAQCFKLLYYGRFRYKTNWFLLTYINIFFLLATLYIVSEAIANQLAFIDNRNYPGGPIFYANQQFSIPVNVMANATHILGTWAADALIVSLDVMNYRPDVFILFYSYGAQS